MELIVYPDIYLPDTGRFQLIVSWPVRVERILTCTVEEVELVILIELVGNAFSTLIVGLYYADVDNIK